MGAAFAPLVATAAFVDRSGYSFEQYLAEFGKGYAGDEYVARQALFEAELAEVNKHNEEYKAGSTHGGLRSTRCPISRSMSGLQSRWARPCTRCSSIPSL